MVSVSVINPSDPSVEKPIRLTVELCPLQHRVRDSALAALQSHLGTFRNLRHLPVWVTVPVGSDAAELCRADSLHGSLWLLPERCL